jgi:hypothetical protein
MSELHGRSIIAGFGLGGGGKSFRAFNPSEGREFGPAFYGATPAEIDRALVAAAQAFAEYRRRSAEEVAGFLESTALQIEALGDELIERAHPETALPTERLAGERARTTGTPDDLREFAWLVPLLENKAGRLIFNGFPTGVEVCASMQHGGPYPATTDPRSTSVGAAAIKRFARPVCYQNFPQEALPVGLRDENERGIWRLVNNRWLKTYRGEERCDGSKY